MITIRKSTEENFFFFKARFKGLFLRRVNCVGGV